MVKAATSHVAYAENVFALNLNIEFEHKISSLKVH